MAYKEAIQHGLECDYKKHPCPLKCGIQIFKHEIDDHQKECQNLSENCVKCTLEYFPNQLKGEEHDCIKELIKATRELKAEEERIKNEQGINYEKINT